MRHEATRNQGSRIPRPQPATPRQVRSELPRSWQSGKRKFFGNRRCREIILATSRECCRRLRRNGIFSRRNSRAAARRGTERGRTVDGTIRQDQSSDRNGCSTTSAASASEREVMRTAVQLVKELLAAKKADGVSERHPGRDLRLSAQRLCQRGFDGKPVATRSRAPRSTTAAPLAALASLPAHAQQLPATNRCSRSTSPLGRDARLNSPAERAAKAEGGRVHRRAFSASTRLRGCWKRQRARCVLPYIATNWFVCWFLRAAELGRLDWSGIDFTRANPTEVTARQSKTAQRRYVKMQPNLRERPLPHRKHEGNVRPPKSGFRVDKSFNQARKTLASSNGRTTRCGTSFGSYHIRALQNAASTARWRWDTDARA